MRSRNIFSWGLLCLFASFVFVGLAEANTLFSIDSHWYAVIRAYAIEDNAIANPVTFSEETIVNGPIGIAASIDLGLAFITYEDADDVIVINSKTLEKVAQVDTEVYDQAGIVSDDVKDKIYIAKRDYDDLYVYAWNETTETLDFESQQDLSGLSYPDGCMGIALDGNHLYVTNGTSTVRCYNTTTWAHESGYDITLTDGLRAYGIAVYNDGAGNRFGYFGGYMTHDKFIKVDLDNPANQTVITPSEGYGVTGVATDPDTGFVYALIHDRTNRVFDTSFNEVYSVETGIEPGSGPAGAAVGRYVPPFDPNITK